MALDDDIQLQDNTDRIVSLGLRDRIDSLVSGVPLGDSPTWTGIHTFSARPVFSAGGSVAAGQTWTVGANTLIGAIADKLNAVHLAQPSQEVGDLLVADGATTMVRLAKSAGVLIGDGASPAWSTTPTLTGIVANALTQSASSALTTSVLDTWISDHATSGAPGEGFGTAALYRGPSVASGARQDMGRIGVRWTAAGSESEWFLQLRRGAPTTPTETLKVSTRQIVAKLNGATGVTKLSRSFGVTDNSSVGFSCQCSDNTTSAGFTAYNDAGGAGKSLELIVNGSAYGGTYMGAAGASLVALMSMASAIAVGAYGNYAMTFGTNNTGRWQIDTSGHFVAFTDATYNIGALGASRPKVVYAKSFQPAAGATVASAAQLPVLLDGDVFLVSGTTSIDFLPGPTHSTTPRQLGSRLTLLFAGILNINHLTVSPAAGWAQINTTTGGAVATAAGKRASFFLAADGIWYQEAALAGA